MTVNVRNLLCNNSVRLMALNLTMRRLLNLHKNNLSSTPNPVHNEQYHVQVM